MSITSILRGENADDFERNCLSLIRYLYAHERGCISTHRRGGMYHADQGVDIEVEFEDRRYAFQCKSGKVDRREMREARIAAARYPHLVAKLIIICAEPPTPTARDEFSETRANWSTAAGRVENVELWGPDELDHEFGDRVGSLLKTCRQAEAALREHIAEIRTAYSGRAMWDLRHATLKDLYVDPECVVHKWGELGGEETGEAEVDPFAESSGPRVPLLDTTLAIITGTAAKEFVVIQGAPGCGKSSFTIHLAMQLADRGYHPIRVALRNLPLAEHPLLEIRISRGEPTLAQLLEMQEFKPVLILDGWDEISRMADEALGKKLDVFLATVRQSILLRWKGRIPVILTGRPSRTVTNWRNLRVGSSILTIRPMRVEKLKEYLGHLEAAYPEAMDASDVSGHLLRRYREYAERVGPGGSEAAEFLGWPLMAHLAFRLLLHSPPELRDVYLWDRTRMLRCLTDYCCRNSRQASDTMGEDEVQLRLSAAELRWFIQAIALRMGQLGREYLMREEIVEVLQSEKAQVSTIWLDDGGPNADAGVVNFYFKPSSNHLACEFMHKSIREYVMAEAIVERLRKLAVTKEERKRPQVWRGMQHDMEKLFSEFILGRESREYFLSQLVWELTRDTEGHLDPMEFRPLQKSLTLGGWAEARDTSAELFVQWATAMEEAEIKPGTSAARYARLGAGLFMANASLHGLVARQVLALEGFVGSGEEFWQGTDFLRHGVQAQRKQSESTEKRNELFRAFYPEPGEVRRQIARINGWAFSGHEEFPEGLFLRFLMAPGTNLERMCLKRADLSWANLAGCNLAGADLRGASLENTYLSGASLERADLRGVRGITLSQAKSVSGWDSALWDDDFRRKLAHS
jgi:hypothetical protein